MTDTRLRVLLAGSLASSVDQQPLKDRVEFRQVQTDEELREAVSRTDVLYSLRIPNNVPAESPDLRWIQLPSAGVDHIRGLPVWSSNILITASQGIHTVPMSEHAMAMLLGLTRQIPYMTRAQERKEWLRNQPRPLGGELRGRTIGILGWGKIGEGVAHLARAFGMRVVGTRWSVIVAREEHRPEALSYDDPPWLEPEDLPPDVVHPAAQTHDVLAQSDVVVMILPLTDETRGSFGDAEFRAMKRGSLFVNIGRGPVVDEGALIKALQSGRLAGAALDVFEKEPLPRSSPLWTMPNVIISPHIGGFSEHTQERAAWLFEVNLTRYLEGQELLNVVRREQGY